MLDPTIHVLSTRPLDAALIAGAAEKGIAIDVVPFISTAPVEDGLLRERTGVLGERKLAVVFTSASAVEVAAAWTGGAKGWTIFCIGAATRQLVEKYFGEASIAGTAGSALALAEKIISMGGEREIFFFCGDQRREELPSALRQAGFAVNELVVYGTRITPHKIERSYEGIVFFSPSAVESFFSVNTVAAGITLFAIGRTTAAAVGDFCSNPVVISEQPDAAILVRRVIDHFQIKNSQH
jgi:uroporphyrinogen-III synthase